MRAPKPSWVRALRMLTGNELDDIRFNEAVGRWEFLLTSADGVIRSQFWGHFDQAKDPFTGLHPARDLDDDGMRQALSGLERTFVGNAFDGAGTTKKEVLKRIEGNRTAGQKLYKSHGEDFADMVNDRAKRLRGALQLSVPVTIGGKAA